MGTGHLYCPILHEAIVPPFLTTIASATCNAIAPPICSNRSRHVSKADRLVRSTIAVDMVGSHQDVCVGMKVLLEERTL